MSDGVPSRRVLGWAAALALALGMSMTVSVGGLGCGETRAQPAHPDGGQSSASVGTGTRSKGAKKPSKAKAQSGTKVKADAKAEAKAAAKSDAKAGDAPEFDEEVAAEVGATQRGESVWYSNSLHGRPTASGERFSRYKMTAAHRTLPMGTTVRVTLVKSGASVVVRVNDRGPFGKKRHRIIDVSEAAAKILGIIDDGRGRVILEVLTLPESRKDKAR